MKDYLFHKLPLGIGRSPFPVSYDGSSVMFGFALFSLIVMSCLTCMIGTMLANHLWKDRHYGYDAVAAIRSLVLAVCVAAFIRCSPEVAYNISYAEASAGTLQTILIIKRIGDTLTLVPFIFWITTFWMWYPTLVIKLRSPTSQVWTDHRFATLWRYAWIVMGSALLAGCVTLGRIFT